MQCTPSQWDSRRFGVALYCSRLCKCMHNTHYICITYASIQSAYFVDCLCHASMIATSKMYNVCLKSQTALTEIIVIVVFV